jgi:peptidoglycan/xylan/chitin deacetylase (PgdA/CDA1 family)
MIGSVGVGVGIRPWAALCLGLLTLMSAPKASAEDCPGHPDALGTSRTLVVDPREHPRIGTMQYPETLPLRDHEVVLTFDDGPLPRNSNQILEILASQCIEATFFEIGQMARAYPEGVRKLRDAGHSIGTHSQNHPLTMNHMPIERARQEIDDGIASVKAALGDDDTALAPFFRIPGLERATVVEDYLASQGIQVWSADFPADDWRHISSSRVYDLAIKRIEAKGKGILLLHDIQARTVAALPRILQELKARGYHIVHVVPATPEQPATPTEPQQWQMHPPSDNVASAHWPKILNFAFADVGTLPAPALSDWDWHEGEMVPSEEPFERASRLARGVPLPREAPWPRQSILPLDTTAIALPVPAQSLFEFKEKSHVVMQAVASSHREEPEATEPEANPKRNPRLTSADAGELRHGIHGRSRLSRARQRMASHHAVRGTRLAMHGHRGTARHPAQVKKEARGGSIRHNL